MRVLLDANLFISYLLTPDSGSAVARVIHAGVSGAFTMLLAEELLAEVRRVTEDSAYVAERIAPEELAELEAILREVAECLPPLNMPIPAVTRDPKDDYLLAYAVAYEADALVTGDRHLLVVGEGSGVLILTPADFLRALEEAGLV